MIPGVLWYIIRPH